MVILLREQAGEEEIRAVTERLEAEGLRAEISRGESRTLISVIGDAGRLDAGRIRELDAVEDVRRITEPYRRVSRAARAGDTVVEVGGVRIGGGCFAMIAGPCAVESREQITAAAEAVRDAGAQILRGGAFKPRSSPYDFQGLREEGLRLLVEAGRRAGLPVVSEIVSPEQLPLFEDVDMIQVGTRNMQNFELLKALGRTDKPVLLKRGMAATLRELLMAAEYIMAGGNGKIVLCERGERGVDNETRSTLDFAAIPLLHEKTHLPVIVDPSHAAGASRLVRPLALAAVAAGADGLIVEVHPDPRQALSDGPQALTPPAFAELVRAAGRLRAALEEKP